MSHTADRPPHVSFPWKYMTMGALLAALVTYGISSLLEHTYQAEAILFVPSMVQEKQIAQDGFSFGAPAEVDAHIEILRSTAVHDGVKARLIQVDSDEKIAKKVARSLKARRTPNGAISLSASAFDQLLAVQAVQAAIDTADAHKSRMLRANRRMASGQAEVRYAQKAEDVNTLRSVLDSLRLATTNAGKEEFIRLQSRAYEYERRLGRAVEELTQYESQKHRLVRAMESDLASTFVLGAIAVDDHPSWPPRGLFALLAFVGVFLLGIFYHYTWRAP